MSDVTCPYCRAEQNIDHEDGYGYEEDQEHEQCCAQCDKAFNFTTSVIRTYEVYCQKMQITIWSRLATGGPECTSVQKVISTTDWKSPNTALGAAK